MGEVTVLTTSTHLQEKRVLNTALIQLQTTKNYETNVDRYIHDCMFQTAILQEYDTVIQHRGKI